MPYIATRIGLPRFNASAIAPGKEFDMITVGIDIGKMQHAVAAITATGETLMPPRFFAQTAEGFAALLTQLRKLGKTADIRIGMEATGNYWLPLRHTLARHGYKVESVNPLITSAEIAKDVRGRKTDKADALAIASALLKNRHNPAPPENIATDALKALTRHRSFMVRQKSNIKRGVHAALDLTFPEVETIFDSLFSATALAVLGTFPSARLISSANLKTLTCIVAKASKGRLDANYARAIRDAARKSVSVGIVNEGHEVALVSLIEQIRFIQGQIEKLEEKIRAMPAPRTAELLASVKGLGTLLPRVIASEIGDMERFRNPPSGKPARDMDKRILAFAGCEPRIRESGKWKGRTKISKRGSPALRTALWQAATMCRLHNPMFTRVYERQTTRGKPHSVAIFYVVRKLVEVFCGMYKTDMPFNLQYTGGAAC
jgi:transposase